MRGMRNLTYSFMINVVFSCNVFDVVSAFVCADARRVVGVKLTLFCNWQKLQPKYPTGNEQRSDGFLFLTTIANREKKQQKEFQNSKFPESG